jgi:hypothetical protein
MQWKQRKTPPPGYMALDIGLAAASPCVYMRSDPDSLTIPIWVNTTSFPPSNSEYVFPLYNGKVKDIKGYLAGRGPSAIVEIKGTGNTVTSITPGKIGWANALGDIKVERKCIVTVEDGPSNKTESSSNAQSSKPTELTVHKPQDTKPQTSASQARSSQSTTKPQGSSSQTSSSSKSSLRLDQMKFKDRKNPPNGWKAYEACVASSYINVSPSGSDGAVHLWIKTDTNVIKDAEFIAPLYDAKDLKFVKNYYKSGKDFNYAVFEGEGNKVVNIEPGIITIYNIHGDAKIVKKCIVKTATEDNIGKSSNTQVSSTNTSKSSSANTKPSSTNTQASSTNTSKPSAQFTTITPPTSSSGMSAKEEVKAVHTYLREHYASDTDECVKKLIALSVKYKDGQLSDAVDNIFLNYYKVASATAEYKNIKDSKELLRCAESDMKAVQDYGCKLDETAIRWSFTILLISQMYGFHTPSMLSKIRDYYTSIKEASKSTSSHASKTGTATATTKTCIDSSNPYAKNEVDELKKQLTEMSKVVKDLQIQNAEMKSMIDQYKSSITAVTAAQAHVPSGTTITQEHIDKYGDKSVNMVKGADKNPTSTNTPSQNTKPQTTQPAQKPKEQSTQTNQLSTPKQTQPVQQKQPATESQEKYIDPTQADNALKILLKFLPRLFLTFLLATMGAYIITFIKQGLGFFVGLVLALWGYPVLVKATFNIVFSNGPFTDLLDDKISNDAVAQTPALKFFKLAGIPKPKLYITSAITFAVGYLTLILLQLIPYLLTFIIGTVVYMQFLGVFKYGKQLAGSYQRNWIDKQNQRQQRKNKI